MKSAHRSPPRSVDKTVDSINDVRRKRQKLRISGQCTTDAWWHRVGVSGHGSGARPPGRHQVVGRWIRPCSTGAGSGDPGRDRPPQRGHAPRLPLHRRGRLPGDRLDRWAAPQQSGRPKSGAAPLPGPRHLRAGGQRTRCGSPGRCCAPGRDPGQHHDRAGRPGHGDRLRAQPKHRYRHGDRRRDRRRHTPLSGPGGHRRG